MNEKATQILLVEDEAAHAELIRRAFASYNGEVALHVAGNLQGARHYLTTTVPNLVISDLRLPDGDGVELLPADDKTLDFPVVIMTSHGDEQVAVEAMKAGALDYVVKSEATLAQMPRTAERALREWGHITERKQAEEALRESEERFRRIFADGPLGMGVVDDKLGLMNVNATLCRMIGYSEEELLGHAVTDFLHPEDQNRDAHLAELLFNGTVPSFTVEQRFLKKNGETIWGRMTASTICDADGNVVYGLSMIEDITEGKRAEEALRASKANLAEAQRIAHLGSWDWHLTDNTLHWSDELYRIFGLDPEVTSISFEQFVDHIYPDDQAYVVEQMQAAVDQQKTLSSIEYRVLLPDGSIRTVRCEGIVSMDDLGRAVRLFGPLQDITERRRLEREILEISNREQRRIGQDLHDDLGQLLTGICFRVAELEDDLLKRNQPEMTDAAEIGELVQEAIGQTRALARGLNPVSMESGGLRTALATLARGIEQIYEIPCILTCPEPVLVDDTEAAAHVYRIAQEALNNAIKHGKASRLEISLLQFDTSITLLIRDNGVGITVPDAQYEGMGLRNMRYRASMIHGSFDVRLGEHGGTVVSCQFTANRAGQPEEQFSLPRE